LLFITYLYITFTFVICRNLFKTQVETWIKSRWRWGSRLPTTWEKKIITIFLG